MTLAQLARLAQSKLSCAYDLIIGGVMEMAWLRFIVQSALSDGKGKIDTPQLSDYHPFAELREKPKPKGTITLRTKEDLKHLAEICKARGLGKVEGL